MQMYYTACMYIVASVFTNVFMWCLIFTCAHVQAKERLLSNTMATISRHRSQKVKQTEDRSVECLCMDVRKYICTCFCMILLCSCLGIC